METLDTITDVPGILVGHDTDPSAATGLTVVLCPGGAVGGVDVRGSAPGTRETDLLRPTSLVQEVHAVLLTGGSAFGLAAADGVVRYLEERGIGFAAGPVRVPIVPAAVLFDLGVGASSARPDAAAGYRACLVAGRRFAEGSVGAGTGATVGKARGPASATKGGVGTASARLPNGVVVGAVVAVNALGDVHDPDTGRLVAGGRAASESDWQGAMPGANTTIGVVATSARLTKEGANKVAQMAQDGLARAIRPAHTMFDGDTLFALSTGAHEAPSSPALVSAVGALAAEVVARAIVRAVERATSLAGVPSAADVRLRDADKETAR
jgi:L-aminopeptidase/D-esterase-like protein